MKFLYVMHDANTGWSKLGISTAPYARLHTVRREYAELSRAALVGIVRCHAAEPVEVEVMNLLALLSKNQRIDICGERFRVPSTDGHRAFFDAAVECAVDFDVYEAAWSVIDGRPTLDSVRSENERSVA